MEKIGVQAVFDDSQFKKGVDDYNRSLGAAEKSTAQFAQEAEKAGAAAGKSKSPLESLNSVLKAVATSAAAAQIGRAVLDLANLGVSAQKAQMAFVAISGGSQQARDNLNAMRAATQGTISDMDAMAAANRLLQMGLASNSQELGQLTEMAVRLGTAMGRDANASIEEFALLLANQSIPRLDTFGISAGKVRTRIAELQAATPGLTREQAFMTAVMEQGTVAMQRLGDAGLGQIQNVDKLKAAWANLRVTVGEMAAPALLKGAGALTTSVVAGNQLVQTLGYAIDKYGYFRGGLMVWQEIFGKSTDLTRDAAMEQHALAAGLEAATQGYMDVGASAQVAAVQVEEMAQASESVDEKLRQLNLTIAGAVGNENKKYADSLADDRAKAAELAAEIAKLEASDGRLVATQSKGAMTAAETSLATQQLAAAQKRLSEATDPLKQAELAVKIEDLQQKLDRAGQSHATYVDNSKRLGEARTELDALNAKMAETEAAHTEAMHKIIYEMMMARLAVDGLTESEVEFAATVAQQMGLVDQETVDAMRSVNAAIKTFNTTGNAQMAASLLAGIADAASSIPTDVTIDVKWNITEPPIDIGKGERPIAFAAGGSRIVTRPTLFVAGERGVGPELVTATPLRGPVDNSRNYTVNLGGAVINTRTDTAALAHGVARQIGRML